MDPEKKEIDNPYAELELEDLPAKDDAIPALVPTEEPVADPVKEEVKEEEEASEIEPEPTAEPVARKRSIYQDLKDKKNEVRTERELREAAERERDELKTKLAEAETPREKEEALDDIAAFAKDIDADPDALRRMKQVFLKDAQTLSPELAAQLKEFQEFQSQNREAIDKVQFDKEFEQATPSIRTLLGEVTADETVAIRTKLNELAHSEQYHDKELDYIAFKNQDVLKALVSPKKRGLEPKGRTESSQITTDFNPNADLSKMSEKESEAWEAEYKKATEVEGLTSDSQGRKIFI